LSKVQRVASTAKPKKSLFWPWFLANAAGYPAAVGVGILVGWYGTTFLANIIGWGMGIAAGGAVIGTAQWIVPKEQLAPLREWLYVTVMGYIFLVPTAGFSVGLAQWFLLRKTVGQAGWWIPASTLAVWLGLAFGVWTSVIAGSGPLGAIIGAQFGGALAGTITGLVLTRLIQLAPERSAA
jgi:hypothetical protein